MSYQIYQAPAVQPGWVEMDGSTIQDTDSPLYGYKNSLDFDSMIYFRVAKTSNQSVSSDGEIITFDTVDVNVGDGYDINLNRFTAPVSGLYQFYYNAIADNSSENVNFIWWVNGQNTKYAGSTTDRSTEASKIFYLNKGDFVEVRTQSTSTIYGSSSALHTHLEGYLINSKYQYKNSYKVPIIKIKMSTQTKLATYYEISGGDFSGLPQISNLDASDKLAVYDVSSGTYQTATVQQLHKFGNYEIVYNSQTDSLDINYIG
jgi:hypothetical protein